MQLWYWLTFLIMVMNVELIGSRRGGGGGRGGSRGGSRTRGGTGLGSRTRGGTGLGSRTSSNINNRGSNYGRGSSSNKGGGISSFSKGNGIGSVLRSNKFKAAIAGAAAGYLTYKAGKAIIKTAGRAMMWGSRPYYWGSSYYQQRSGYEMCSMPLSADDSKFGNVQFGPDAGIGLANTRPKQIVWSCRSYTERCCGYECCPSGGYGGGGRWGVIFGVLILFLLLLCCGGFILFKFFRKSLDCLFPSQRHQTGMAMTEGNKFDDVPINTPAPGYTAYNYAPSQSSYPQGSYPTQNAYPPQYPSQPTYAPAQPYPSQPPAYGFNT